MKKPFLDLEGILSSPDKKKTKEIQTIYLQKAAQNEEGFKSSLPSFSFYSDDELGWGYCSMGPALVTPAWRPDILIPHNEWAWWSIPVVPVLGREGRRMAGAFSAASLTQLLKSRPVSDPVSGKKMKDWKDDLALLSGGSQSPVTLNKELWLWWDSSGLCGNLYSCAHTPPLPRNTCTPLKKQNKLKERKALEEWHPSLISGFYTYMCTPWHI